MTLKEIEYLLTTAQCTSISEAAKQMYVAQPSLTHAIQSVEREVGFRIFERGRSGVSVTEQGEEFLTDIRGVYEQMSAIQDKYCVEKRPIRRVFSISAQYFSWTAQIFARFLRELDDPYFSVKLLEGKLADIIADVSADRSEIGFIHFPVEKETSVLKELRSEKLEFYGIAPTDSCLLLREGHPLTSHALISRGELLHYPAVFYDYRTDSSTYMAEEDPSLLQADKRVIISNGMALLQILLETDAYAVGVCAGKNPLEPYGIVDRPFEGGQLLQTGWIKKGDTMLQPVAKKYLRMLNPA